MNFLKEYFNKENLKIKLRNFILPQLVFSLLIALLYPFFILYLAFPLNRFIYKITQWEIFEARWLLSIFIFPFIILLAFHIFYGRNIIRIFIIESFSRKFCTSIFPGVIGFISAGLILSHIFVMGKRLLTIKDISGIKERSDSTDVYRIENYEIDYENYFYSVGLYDEKKGSRFNRYYQTEISLYIICPFIDSNHPNQSNRYWAAFHLSEEMDDTYDYNSPETIAKEKELLEKFKKQEPIQYFEETRYFKYTDLLKEKLNQSTIPPDIRMLAVEFEPYEPYNGHQYLLVSFFIFIGGNIFIFLMLIFVRLNPETVKN